MILLTGDVSWLTRWQTSYSFAFPQLLRLDSTAVALNDDIIFNDLRVWRYYAVTFEQR